ncbi:MAG: NUDIX domain-containing protein [Alistipes senegalensis]|nr:NUDIX domain-containing protein [Bacteroides cellulosilyticus]MCM1351367.1 NUDIX domain-containing protein [Alistipes senegalensis]
METTVYFADKSVLFTAKAPAGFPDGAVVRDLAETTRDKILKILETRNSACVATPQPEAAFARFAAGFVQVEAAGGIVVDGAGRWLMIHRNGRWDLPKGHVEEGESCEDCAAREIAEETGVRAEVVRPLCATWHAYWFPKTARWELKRTHWYELRAEQCDGLQPQTEEGIERVAWVSAKERPALLENAFPTIREVARSMRD